MSSVDSRLLNRLLAGEHLGETEAESLLVRLTDPELSGIVAGALLAALRAKGETAEEVRGLARAMRRLALRPSIPDGAPTVDTVGTGGDGSGSLNLSTASALLAAACGQRVVKHGNRSISSRSGSADALERLGMPLPLDETAAVDCLGATGFTFLFAPYYHPAMKTLAPVRAALGVRTVFNILGPLTNPAEPPFQLIGAFDEPTAQLMAESLSGLPLRRAFVVHGAHGWDEPTPSGPFVLFDVEPGRVRREVRDPADLGVPHCEPTELLGADAEHNARRLRAVLRGEERGAHRSAVTLGTGLVLELTGAARDAREGIAAAESAIDSGAGADVLDRLAAFGIEAQA